MEKNELSPIYERIGKDEFLKAYNNHLPDKYTRFVYRYCSTEVTKKDRWFKNTVMSILLSTFVIQMFCVIFEYDGIVLKASAYTFIAILFMYAILFITGWLFNTFRLKSICRELDVTSTEYNILANYYYDDIA